MSALAKTIPVQLTLGLPFEERLGLEDFIPGSANEQALDFLQSFPDWPARVVLLIGPEGSGKTHLSAIWADLAGAQRHRAKNLRFETMAEWLSSGALVLEDADCHDLDETALFHLVNDVRSGAGYLVITASEPVSAWGLTVPDLLSRLRAAVPVVIGAPDDTLLRQVIVKQFADRQIAVEPDLIEFLASRLERSLDAVRRVVALLDEAAIAQRRKITVRFASAVLDFETLSLR
ncbi:MAG: hypothetical protein AAGE61_01130 [Pseudomonadota bacterium]